MLEDFYRKGMYCEVFDLYNENPLSFLNSSISPKQIDPFEGLLVIDSCLRQHGLDYVRSEAQVFSKLLIQAKDLYPAGCAIVLSNLKVCALDSTKASWFISHVPHPNTVMQAARLRMLNIQSYRLLLAPSTHQSVHNLAICLQIKDEDDIIYANLVHNYRLGARYFCILNNLSTDNTQNEIARFEQDYGDSVVVTISDKLLGYYQRDKMVCCATFASSYFNLYGSVIDFILPLDADEFITFGGDVENYYDLIEILNKENYRFLLARLIDCSRILSEVNENTERDYESFDYQSLPSLFSMWNAMDYRISDGFPITKCLVRTNDIPNITQGNHMLSADSLNPYCGLDLMLGDDYNITISHLNLRSFQHTLKKIVNGGKSLNSTNLPESSGIHWRRMYKSLQEEGEGFAKRKFLDYVQTTASHTRLPTCNNMFIGKTQYLSTLKNESPYNFLFKLGRDISRFSLRNDGEQLLSNNLDLKKSVFNES